MISILQQTALATALILGFSTPADARNNGNSGGRDHGRVPATQRKTISKQELALAHRVLDVAHAGHYQRGLSDINVFRLLRAFAVTGLPIEKMQVVVIQGVYGTTFRNPYQWISAHRNFHAVIRWEDRVFDWDASRRTSMSVSEFKSQWNPENEQLQIQVFAMSVNQFLRQVQAMAGSATDPHDPRYSTAVNRLTRSILAGMAMNPMNPLAPLMRYYR